MGGSAGLQLVPDLAVSLPTPTDGGRSYSFQLRPGIRYSTGALVRPQDFRRAIERTLDLARQGAFNAPYYADIVGARSCLAAPKKPCDLSRGIETHAGSNTVTFHLTSPDPDFLYKLDLPSAFAVPAGTPLHPRGFLPATGPYEIASFDPKRGIRLVRNPRFREWSPAAQPSGFPDAIVERFQGSPDAHVAAVLHGSADLASGETRPSPTALASVRTQHASQLEVNPWDITYFLALNTRVPPFDDVRARQALNFAVDRERLKDLTVGPGLGQVTCQVLAPKPPGVSPVLPLHRRAERERSVDRPYLAACTAARALLRHRGRGRHRLDTRVDSLRRERRQVRRLGARQPRVQGAASGSLPISRFRTSSTSKRASPAGSRTYAAPSDFFEQDLTCSAYNRVNSENNNTAEFCDPAIDREIARAQSLQTSDPEAASRLWAKVDRDVVDQAPWVPFANGVALEVVSARVGNYQYNPQWGTLLDQLWVR